MTAAMRVPLARTFAGMNCKVAMTAESEGSVPAPNASMPAALSNGYGNAATTISMQ